MVGEKDYYITKVPADLVKFVDMLSAIGFTNSEIFIRALKEWSKRGLDVCSKELIEEKLAAKGFKIEKEVKGE